MRGRHLAKYSALLSRLDAMEWLDVSRLTLFNEFHLSATHLAKTVYIQLGQPRQGWAVTRDVGITGFNRRGQGIEGLGADSRVLSRDSLGVVALYNGIRSNHADL